LDGKEKLLSWGPVAHAYTPSYSGGRDKKDHSLKPAWANISQDPILKKPCTKKKKIGLVKWLKVKALNSSPSTAKKKNKIKITEYLIYYLFFYMFLMDYISFLSGNIADSQKNRNENTFVDIKHSSLLTLPYHKIEVLCNILGSQFRIELVMFF
jgi:hypothetical protein